MLNVLQVKIQEKFKKAAGSRIRNMLGSTDRDAFLQNLIEAQ